MNNARWNLLRENLVRILKYVICFDRYFTKHFAFAFVSDARCTKLMDQPVFCSLEASQQSIELNWCCSAVIFIRMFYKCWTLSWKWVVMAVRLFFFPVWLKKSYFLEIFPSSLSMNEQFFSVFNMMNVILKYPKTSMQKRFEMPLLHLNYFIQL